MSRTVYTLFVLKATHMVVKVTLLCKGASQRFHELLEAYFKTRMWKLNDEHISIHHECEGGIEKSVPRITVWHHEACRVMTNDD